MFCLLPSLSLSSEFPSFSLLSFFFFSEVSLSFSSDFFPKVFSSNFLVFSATSLSISSSVFFGGNLTLFFSDSPSPEFSVVSFFGVSSPAFALSTAVEDEFSSFVSAKSSSVLTVTLSIRFLRAARGRSLAFDSPRERRRSYKTHFNTRINKQHIPFLPHPQ